MLEVSEIAVDDALFGEVLSPRVAEIIERERRADEHDAAADTERWEAARLIAEELDSGTSERRLAAQIGQSKSVIHYKAGVWRWSLKRPGERPPFNQVYNSPEIRTASEKPEPEPAPEPLPLADPESDVHRGEIGNAEEYGWGEPDTERQEEPARSDGPPSAEDEVGTADDLDPGEPGSVPYGPPSAGGPAEPDPRPGTAPEGTLSRSDGARGKLDRLRQMADEAERENPDEPIDELLDVQRALRALISKTRLYRAAGLEINAPALVSRIDSLYHEWKGLL